MTRHDPRVRLRHMLDHAVEAVEMADGRVREDFDRDRQFNLAIVRLLEIIGEAAARVPAPINNAGLRSPGRTSSASVIELSTATIR